jgi:hypothetical protein
VVMVTVGTQFARLETALAMQPARGLANAEQHLDGTRNLLQFVWLRRALEKRPWI